MNDAFVASHSCAEELFTAINNMHTMFDEIIEIGIDKSERLYIKPAKEKFTMIYRSATEVHWDLNGNFLYSPKPREWSYLDWYKHIVSTIINEYNCTLKITNSTFWVNIPEGLKRDIEHLQ